jgi:hypothetical protein
MIKSGGRAKLSDRLFRQASLSKNHTDAVVDNS